MHSLAVPSTAPVDGAEAGRAPLHVGRPPTPRPATKTSGPHPLPSRLCHLIKPRIQSRHSQSTAIASTTTKTAHHSKMQQDPSPSREIYYQHSVLKYQVLIGLPPIQTLRTRTVHAKFTILPRGQDPRSYKQTTIRSYKIFLSLR